MAKNPTIFTDSGIKIIINNKNILTNNDNSSKKPTRRKYGKRLTETW
jgi:hypothetical protein